MFMEHLATELEYYQRNRSKLKHNEQYIVELYGVEGFNYIKRNVKPPKVRYPHIKTPLNEYRKEVRRLTELQPLHLLEGFNDRGFFSLHVDHIVSIVDAFNLGWTPEQCAHISNLQMLTHKENGLKVHKSYCKLPRQIIFSS